MYVGNEIMVVTSVAGRDYKLKSCQGISFSGELDKVSKYYIEENEQIQYNGVNVEVGDLIYVDAKAVESGKLPFSSGSQKERINNITTLFMGLRKCAETKIPEYMQNGTFSEETRKYVWQYLHAVKKLAGALDTMNRNEKMSLSANAKTVCLSKMMVFAGEKSYNLDKKLSEKEKYLLVENQMEAINILNKAPDSCFVCTTGALTPCDNDTHEDYFLVTGRNEDGETFNGILLSNLRGKNETKSSLKFAHSISCSNGYPLIGDLVGVETIDDTQTLNKEDSYPKTFEQRMSNLQFVNEVLFEHYVQNANKDFSTPVYNSQLGIAKGMVEILGDKIYNISDENQIDKNKATVYRAVAAKLKDDYLAAKREGNVKSICSLNEQIYSVQPILDLPKRAFAGKDSKQQTLDMF